MIVNRVIVATALIAATGLALAAYPVAVERGLMTAQAAI